MRIAVQARLIADALHVERADEKHKEAMKKYGLKDADLRQLVDTIHAVEKISFEIKGDESMLETVRNSLKDGLGRHRTSADLVCNTSTRRHPSLEREMRLGGRLPRRDTALRGYVHGLDNY